MAQDAWHDLREQFIALTDALNIQDETWRGVWRLLAEHPWSRAQLEICARWVLRDQSERWLDDVRQEALLVLARSLRRAPDLHFDPLREPRYFPGWMRTILTNHCREAMRGFRRRLPDMAALDERIGTADPLAAADRRMDLAALFSRLNDPERRALDLFHQGYTPREIADEIGTSPTQPYRLLKRGIRQLRAAQRVPRRLNPRQEQR